MKAASKRVAASPTDDAALLAACQEAVERAKAAGAEQVEVYASGYRETKVGFQKNDLNLVGASEERTFGIRLLKDQRLGFATTNRADRLDEAIAAALSLAKASPADEHLALPGPAELGPISSELVDPALMQTDPAALASLGAELLGALQTRDSRITIDTLELDESVGAVAIASSSGIASSVRATTASGTFFGMAVDGDEVGSFAIDGAQLRNRAGFRSAMDEAAVRFVDKCVGALGAGQGESFRGTVLVPPEALASFVVSPLVAMLKADAVRQGQSPLADKVSERIASAGFTLMDEGLGLPGYAAAPFDREGQARRRRALVDDGVLQGFLYDSYEARRAGTVSTGNARGGASSPPSIGPTALSLDPGSTPLAELARLDKGIVLTRFSGSIEPTTGDFSGVVKGGFLVEKGARRPIRETTIAGNIWEVLERISGISAERELLFGSSLYPWVRLEDVAITAV